jgi:membrane protein
VGIDFLVITLVFALMFKYLPDVQLAFKDVYVGALFTTILFLLGKYLIGLYLGTRGFDSSYGAASSIVLLMAWIYYSSQILLFGAEFTKVYVNRFGEGMEPDPGVHLLSVKQQ